MTSIANPIKFRNERMNKNEEDDGFAETIIPSDEDKYEATPKNEEDINISRRSSAVSSEISRQSPRPSASHHVSSTDNSPITSRRNSLGTSRESFSDKSSTVRLQSPSQNKLDHLSPPKVTQPQSTTDKRDLPISFGNKSFSSSFGSYLSVPVSPRASHSVRSASPLTDEGIETDDLLYDATGNYIQNEMTNDQELGALGVPGVFCACCYNPKTKQLMRASIPAAMQSSIFFGENRVPLLRIKSEESPRTEPPYSVRWGHSSQHNDPYIGEIKKTKQRKIFESRGHSVSDAKVRYRPVSDEFQGIKEFRNRRKLPDIPQNSKTHRARLVPTQKSIIRRKGTQEDIRPPVGQHKPPLRRQRNECMDSNEDLRDSDAIDRNSNLSVRFDKSARGAVWSEKFTIKNEGATETSVDFTNNNYIDREVDSLEPKDSMVFFNKNTQSTGISLLHHRARSVDASRRLPNLSDVAHNSKSLDVEGEVDGNPRSDDTMLPPEGNDVIRPETVTKSTSIESFSEIEASINDDKNSVFSNETSSKQVSAEAHLSIAERLKSVAPSDQRRVQGIVQDVFIEMGEERILQYKSAFAKFDKDSSGIISSKQLRRLLRTLGHNPGDDELRELVNQVDMDENGKIDFNEFIIMVGHFDKANNTSEDLSHIFRVFDERKGGSINVSELRTICSEYLVGTVPVDKINEMIDFVDRDGDGEINRDELCRVWTNQW